MRLPAPSSPSITTNRPIGTRYPRHIGLVCTVCPAVSLRSAVVAVPTEVDCVVVSYNSATDLPACIDSLTSQEGVSPCVVVVDNLSSDDSVGTARQLGSVVIANDSNRGFAAAVNQGLQLGSAPWVLILNPDAQMMCGALCALLERAQAEASVGCVGPRTLDDDGTEYPSRRSFPGIMTATIHGLLGSVWPANPATRRYHADDTPHDQASIVDWVSGSCMLLPRRAWESVGGFDERYFMYVEDMDLCFRLRRAGWKTVYEPTATIMHARGQSSRHRPLRSVLHHHVGAARFYWRSANRWHRPITWPVAVLVLAVRSAAQVSAGALRAGR
ncbi:MAG: glycosyltransferase family 2 protein [Pseudonocardiaceae bacterium]